MTFWAVCLNWPEWSDPYEEQGGAGLEPLQGVADQGHILDRLKPEMNIAKVGTLESGARVQFFALEIAFLGNQDTGER
jgi:hypothetical protein